jgi:hypothetical protein
MLPEPVRIPRPLLNGSWWPLSTDLGVELAVLLPALDHVRGPVKRLLLGVGGWKARPSRINADDRTVSVGYAAGQSPAMIKVFCVDGGSFTMRVTLPGSASGVPERPDDGLDEEIWEDEGGGLRLLRSRAGR